MKIRNKKGQFKKFRFDRICLDCGKKLAGYKSKRCSICAVKERIKKFPMLSGTEAVAWKTGEKVYRKYFLKESCEDCGSKKNIVVHHLDKNRKNNNTSNLKTVCTKCHFNIYHKRKFYGNQYTKIKDRGATF
jgi:hypothetical protein